jgi:competence ComEA-like helix-hairpin-helix protein
MPFPFKRLHHRLLYPIRERLVCSEKEAIAMIVLLGVIFSGHVIRIVQATSPPFDDRSYAEMDSVFEALSARADSAEGLYGMVPVDTIHTGFGASYDAIPIRQEGVESWVLVDTLEKPAADFPIPVNSAPARVLQALPRIGPAMADRILKHRIEHGPFMGPEDLLAVRGIGPKTLERLLPLIIFDVAADSTRTP